MNHDDQCKANGSPEQRIPDRPINFGGISDLPPGEIKFMRQGIIPCGRCAFFGTSIFGKSDPISTRGTCRAKSATAFKRWAEVSSDPEIGDGCGEGLLREEAAPLPPEVR